MQPVARDEHFVQVSTDLKYPVLHVDALVADVQVLAPNPQAVQEPDAKKYPSIQLVAAD